MKKIRLKDRMWFGKYSGARISDVLLKDKKVLDELCSKGIIEYDDKIIKFLNDHCGFSEKSSLGFTTRVFEPEINRPNPIISRRRRDMENHQNEGNVVVGNAHTITYIDSVDPWTPNGCTTTINSSITSVDPWNEEI